MWRNAQTWPSYINQVWVIELVQENWNNDLGPGHLSKFMSFLARIRKAPTFVGPFGVPYGSMLFDISLNTSKHRLCKEWVTLHSRKTCQLSIILCTKRWRNVSNVHQKWSKHLYMNSLWYIYHRFLNHVKMTSESFIVHHPFFSNTINSLSRPVTVGMPLKAEAFNVPAPPWIFRTGSGK